MKEGSLFVLFCFVCTDRDPLNWDASHHILDLWKALDEKGCMGFGSMTFGLVVQNFLNIE
jgi:hypothetical protein